MHPQPSLANPLHGGCQCGTLRYAITSPILTFYACHCLHCQHQSASAFGLSFWVKVGDFKFLQGKVASFESRGGSGSPKTGAFCERCGTRIFNHGGATRPDELTARSGDVLSLKGGTLDRINEINPVSHIWLHSAQPWVRKMIEATYPDMPCFEGEPDDKELLSLWQRSGQG